MLYVHQNHICLAIKLHFFPIFKVQNLDFLYFVLLVYAQYFLNIQHQIKHGCHSNMGDATVTSESVPVLNFPMLSSEKQVLPPLGNSLEDIIFMLLNIMFIREPSMQPFLLLPSLFTTFLTKDLSFWKCKSPASYSHNIPHIYNSFLCGCLCYGVCIVLFILRVLVCFSVKNCYHLFFGKKNQNLFPIP